MWFNLKYFYNTRACYLADIQISDTSHPSEQVSGHDRQRTGGQTDTKGTEHKDKKKSLQ